MANTQRAGKLKKTSHILAIKMLMLLQNCRNRFPVCKIGIIVIIECANRSNHLYLRTSKSK